MNVSSLVKKYQRHIADNVVRQLERRFDEQGVRDDYAGQLKSVVDEELKTKRLVPIRLVGDAMKIPREPQPDGTFVATIKVHDNESLVPFYRFESKPFIYKDSVDAFDLLDSEYITICWPRLVEELGVDRSARRVRVLSTELWASIESPDDLKQVNHALLAFVQRYESFCNDWNAGVLAEVEGATGPLIQKLGVERQQIHTRVKAFEDAGIEFSD